MRVKQIKNILGKIIKILEAYEDCSLDQMLDDIQLKVVANGKDKKVQNNERKTIIDFEKIQQKILILNNQEDILKELSELDKDDLIEFGKFVEVRVSKKDSKSSIARTIAGHINFPRLNERISQREKSN